MSILNKVSDQIKGNGTAGGFVPTVCYVDGSTENIVFCCVGEGNMIEFYTEKEHYLLNGNTGVFFKIRFEENAEGKPVLIYSKDESVKEIDIYG